MDQIARDRYFMRIAWEVSRASTCRRRAVGAVLVKDNRILSTGYNGAPSGLPHCTDDHEDCLRDILNVPSGQRYDICRAAHAELNAIAFAARHGISIEGATLYCIFGPPCGDCAKYIINAGITRVVYEKTGLTKLHQDTIQRLEEIKEMLRYVGIEVMQLPPEKGIPMWTAVGNETIS